MRESTRRYPGAAVAPDADDQGKDAGAPGENGTWRRPLLVQFYALAVQFVRLQVESLFPVQALPFDPPGLPVATLPGDRDVAKGP